MAERGLTDTDLSELTSPVVARSTIQRHRVGDAHLTPYYMEIYAKALKIRAEELLPNGLRLDAQDRDLLTHFRQLDAGQRGIFLETLRGFSERAARAPLPLVANQKK